MRNVIYLLLWVLLIGSDQKGSQFDAVWERAIRDSITGLVDMESLRIVHVADVRGVPFFLKGVLRCKFPGGNASPIILDWQGRFATAYGFAKDKANILVFDRQARLKHQKKGPRFRGPLIYPLAI